MQRFVNDDPGYVAWLAAHPTGWVLNTYAHVSSDYLVLHRAACRTVNRPLRPGRSWTVQYGKTCSDDRAEIEAWALRETSKPVKACGRCLAGDASAQVASHPTVSRPQPGGGRTPRSIDTPVSFDGDSITIIVPRGRDVCGPRLVIEGAQWLAEIFFRRDPSAAAEGSYDAWIRETQLDPNRRDRVVDGDVTAVNRTMAARTSHKAWAPVVKGDRAWLVALAGDWDLFETDESDVPWTTMARGLEVAFKEIRRPRLGFAVVTKVLHIKRPRLIPVMDSVVMGQIGARVTADTASWVEAIGQLRAVGRLNLDALRGVRDHLRSTGIDERTLVRILDALLWISSPGAGLFEDLGDWERVIRPRRGADCS